MHSLFLSVAMAQYKCFDDIQGEGLFDI